MWTRWICCNRPQELWYNAYMIDEQTIQDVVRTIEVQAAYQAALKVRAWVQAKMAEEETI
jgi:hypothetical protein